MKMQAPAIGSFLKAARNSRQLSLRAVEKAVEISNAYLSQLESGKIQGPSPVILHRLSELYQVPYADVMQLAGYPFPKPEMNQPSLYSRLALSLGPVTIEEEEALTEYLHFLRWRGKASRRRKK